MEIDTSFYTEIFEKEAYWISLTHNNLLNTYYINGNDGLKDFYQKKLSILEIVKEEKPNTKFIIDMIKSILNEIESITNLYNSGEDININKLVDLFITNQLTNKKSN